MAGNERLLADSRRIEEAAVTQVRHIQNNAKLLHLLQRLKTLLLQAALVRPVVSAVLRMTTNLVRIRKHILMVPGQCHQAHPRLAVFLQDIRQSHADAAVLHG